MENRQKNCHYPVLLSLRCFYLFFQCAILNVLSSARSRLEQCCGPCFYSVLEHGKKLRGWWELDCSRYSTLSAAVFFSRLTLHVNQPKTHVPNEGNPWLSLPVFLQTEWLEGLMGNTEYIGTRNVATRERSRERVGLCDFFVDIIIISLLGSTSHYHASYRFKLQE